MEPEDDGDWLNVGMTWRGAPIKQGDWIVLGDPWPWYRRVWAWLRWKDPFGDRWIVTSVREGETVTVMPKSVRDA